MTTIVALDTGQVLGIVDRRDIEGVGDWLFARPLQWRLGVQVVAIDPSAAFRKALRMWLPSTADSVDAFHLVVKRAIAGPGSTGRSAGNEPAMAHRLPAVEGEKSQNEDSLTHGTAKRLSRCAVPQEQRQDHASRQNIHHEP